MISFLEAANNINGLLITLLVKKRVQSVLEPGGVAYLREIEPSLADWKNETVEKLYRILGFLAFLHAGLCYSDQRTYWLTDNDEIAANPERLTSAVRMLQRISTDHFARRIHLGSADTVNSMDAKISGQIKDIASIPDLVGGALVDAWSATARCGFAGGSGKPLRMPKEIPEKAKAIIEWFMQQEKPLRRHFAAIDLLESDPNLLDFKWLRFSEAQL